MKTEKLPDVPKQEPGDFYYHHLRLPYADGAQAEPRFEPDPTIESVTEVSAESSEHLGFVILRKNSTVEIVDALTGQHVRIVFGKPTKRRRTDETPTR